MWNRVFILSMPNDIHAFAVREAIERLGGEAHLYLTTNFPKLHTETLEVDHAGDFRIHLEGIEAPLKGGNGWTVWNRRPSYQIDEANLHPADRGFASLQCRRFRAGLMGFLLPDAFWVNPLVSSELVNKSLVRSGSGGLGRLRHCGVASSDESGGGSAVRLSEKLGPERRWQRFRTWSGRNRPYSIAACSRGVLVRPVPKPHAARDSASGCGRWRTIVPPLGSCVCPEPRIVAGRGCVQSR